MRQIKFRAWDKVHKIMMEPSYFGVDEYISPEGEVLEKETHSGYGFSDMYMVDISEKRILMQYTGLKDKNGVEIYEDDLLKLCNSIFKLSFEGDYNFGYILHYAKTGDYFTMLNADHLNQIEVIGNIHERPELVD